MSGERPPFIGFWRGGGVTGGECQCSTEMNRVNRCWYSVAQYYEHRRGPIRSQYVALSMLTNIPIADSSTNERYHILFLAVGGTLAILLDFGLWRSIRPASIPPDSTSAKSSQNLFYKRKKVEEDV
jgi:hypothetical protein